MENIFKFLIIEDEPQAATRLRKIVEKTMPQLNGGQAVCLGVANAVTEAAKLIAQHPDANLIFLDIELADGQSFEIQKLTPITQPVIFTTAYDQFALKAFELHSIDYLLKPITEEAITKALQKYLHRYTADKQSAPPIEALLGYFANVQQNNKRDRFLIKIGEKFIPVKTKDIAYFTGDNNGVFAVTHTATHLPFDLSLDKLELELDSQKFFRVNRQIIVNIDAIADIETFFNGKLKLKLKPELKNPEPTVSRDRARDFKTWMGY